MERYFFAVAPPSPVLEAIDELRGRYGHSHHKVEPHVTVKVPFTWPGDPEAFLTPVRAACAGVAPFEMGFGGTGRFVEAGVLYLEIPGAGVLHLHLTVVTALTGLVEADSRGHEGGGYTPHLTLAVQRFGIDAWRLDQMEEEAGRLVSSISPFWVESLRCYSRERADHPWQPLVDLPLGGGATHGIMGAVNS